MVSCAQVSGHPCISQKPACSNAASVEGGGGRLCKMQRGSRLFSKVGFVYP